MKRKVLTVCAAIFFLVVHYSLSFAETSAIVDPCQEKAASLVSQGLNLEAVDLYQECLQKLEIKYGVLNGH